MAFYFNRFINIAQKTGVKHSIVDSKWLLNKLDKEKLPSLEFKEVTVCVVKQTIIQNQLGEDEIPVNLLKKIVDYISPLFV